jgi:hypothetical protein
MEITFTERIPAASLFDCAAGPRAPLVTCLFRDAVDGSFHYISFKKKLPEFVLINGVPATSYAPDVQFDGSGQRLLITVTASDGTLRRAAYSIADDKFVSTQGESDAWMTLEGRLVSGPSCSQSYCVGRGPKGTVLIGNANAFMSSSAPVQ